MKIEFNDCFFFSDLKFYKNFKIRQPNLIWTQSDFDFSNLNSATSSVVENLNNVNEIVFSIN